MYCATVSVMQKYFMSSGMGMRISFANRKKLSIERRDVNTMAVCSRIEIFCARNSFGVNGSTLMKGRNTISTLWRLAMS